MANRHITLDTVVRVVDVDQNPGNIDWRGTLREFFKENDFSLDEIVSIDSKLTRRGEVTLGGGAQPIVKVVAEIPGGRVMAVSVTHSGALVAALSDDWQPLTLQEATGFGVAAAFRMNGLSVVTVDGDMLLLGTRERNLSATTRIVNRLYGRTTSTAA